MYILNYFLLGALFAILVGSLTGQPEFLFMYISTYLRLWLIYITLGIIVILIGFLVLIIRNRYEYNRNRNATLLLRKARQHALTEDEVQQVKYFMDTGVLTYNSMGQLRLSDQAVRDVLTW